MDSAVVKIDDVVAALRANEPWLRRVLMNRLGDRAMVDDVYQEVSLAASRQELLPKHHDQIVPWLYRVCVRQVFLCRRKLGRVKKLMASVADRNPQNRWTEDDPLDWLLGRERQQAVRKALSQLNDLDREILTLKYGEGWTYNQLAKRLGVSFYTIEHRILKAKKRLRKLLSRENVEVVK